MMVWLVNIVVFILFVQQNVSSKLVQEESKKVYATSKKSHKSASNNHFHCDLSLLPSQKKMMYYGEQLRDAGASFDIYKWPKNQNGFVIVPYWISRNSHYSE
jgi:hypothetical protein